MERKYPLLPLLSYWSLYVRTCPLFFFSFSLFSKLSYNSTNPLSCPAKQLFLFRYLILNANNMEEKCAGLASHYYPAITFSDHVLWSLRLFLCSFWGTCCCYNIWLLFLRTIFYLVIQRIKVKCFCFFVIDDAFSRWAFRIHGWVVHIMHCRKYELDSFEGITA